MARRASRRSVAAEELEELPMGTVVVGVEESDRSLDALALARRLACRADALLLVCAYPVDPLMTGDGGAGYARPARAG
jgi:hypothetical protein